MKFGARAERFSPDQVSLLKEAADADLEALARELDGLAPASMQWPTGIPRDTLTLPG